MTISMLTLGGALLLGLMISGALLLRDLRLEKEFSARVRSIKGHTPEPKAAEIQDVFLAAWRQIVTSVGMLFLRFGLVPSKTHAELELMLRGSGLTGPQGIGLFVVGKCVCPFILAGLAWLLVQHFNVRPRMQPFALPIAGVIGLIVPDKIVAFFRKRYLRRVEQGLPDALDLMVICTQAGLALGPAVVRVANELRHAYRELAIEFAQTANELQIMSDSRIALINLGTRTDIAGFKRLSATLIQTIHYGTPVSEALRILSNELRQESLMQFEERAARLPVMLTLPMIIFILPCVFIVAGGPAMLQVTRAFAP